MESSSGQRVSGSLSSRGRRVETPSGQVLKVKKFRLSSPFLSLDPYCASSRALTTHVENCNHSECLLCLPHRPSE